MGIVCAAATVQPRVWAILTRPEKVLLQEICAAWRKQNWALWKNTTLLFVCGAYGPAAIWVWESLWSPTRRHAWVDILDVALFDGGGNSEAIPTLSRWFFTAKDGRVMKKTTSNTSVGALKQALLGRALHGESEGSSGSRITENARATIFATALLSSGESVPLEEGSWTSLVVGGRWKKGSVAAVMALEPSTSGPMKLRQGSRQRVICEHRVKTDCTTPEEMNRAFGNPLHSSVTTYVSVSSELLGQIGGQDQHPEQRKYSVTARTTADPRLVSRGKATNDAVETKMHHIVQWVQEVRRVCVLSMTAAFVVLPSGGKGLPGVWLERALDISVVPKYTACKITAPIAGSNLTSRFQDFQGAGGRHLRGSRFSSSAEQSGEPGSNVSRTEGAASPKELAGLANVAFQTESALGGASETAEGTRTLSESPICGSTLNDSAENSSISSEIQSMKAMMSTAGDALPPIHEIVVSQAHESPRDVDVSSSSIATVSCCGQPGRSTTNSDAACATYKRLSCAGDFCAFQRPSQCSLPANAAERDRKAGVVAQLDWTDVGVSNESGTLLEISERTTPRFSDGKNSGIFSITFKSVGLARMEAKDRHDFHWDESLREYWRENGGKAVGLRVPGATSAYGEVRVCRACYEVYRRLDKLRGQADREGVRGPCVGDMLAMMGDAAVSGNRAAAAEAGAARLRTEFMAMVEEVDAGTGKQGIEAGKMWRRGLSRGRDLDTARSQALLTRRLTQPKQKPKTTEDDEDVIPPSGSKRKVKSEGGTSQERGRLCERNTSGSCGFPSLRSRPSPTLPRRQGIGTIFHQEAKGGACYRTPLLRGTSRRMAWCHREDTDGREVARDYGEKVTSQTSNAGRHQPGEACPGGDRGSRTTIRAIATMLEKGAEDYLPTCVRDLPEAASLLGSQPAPSSDQGDGRERRHCTARLARRSKGLDKKKAVDGECRRDPGRGELLNSTSATDSRRRTLSGPSPEDRFLHPWQRSLEAEKRLAAQKARREAALKKALMMDQNRGGEARGAITESENCRRARERTVARLGHRQRQPRRPRRRSGEETGLLESSGEHRKYDPPIFGEEIDRSAVRDVLESKDTGGSARPGGRGADGVPHERDCITQMRDALGWAHKTLEAILKRLKRRGLAVNDAGQGKGEPQLLNELRKHLTAFEEEGVTLSVEATAPENLAGDGQNTASFESRCYAACESFETDFSRLIDELTSTAKPSFRHPQMITLGTGRCDADTPADRPRLEIQSTSQPPTKTAPRIRISCVRLCPSCSVLPVARRCLDCEGDDAERNRCAGCFVRGHRDETRSKHRFLRICSGGATGTVVSSSHGVAKAGQATDQDEQARARANFTRCSRCDDLAVARHCRDCGDDMCAACHFLAHRTPSRQAHVTELVGETALAMQEAFHKRNEATDAQAGEGAVEKRCPSSASPAFDHNERETGDASVKMTWACGPDFGKDAAQSLVQVRRTIETPLVRPLSRSSSRASATSLDSSDNRHGGTPTIADGESGASRSDGSREKGELIGGESDCLDARVRRNGAEARRNDSTEVTNKHRIDGDNCSFASATVAGGGQGKGGAGDGKQGSRAREDTVGGDGEARADESRAMSDTNRDGPCCSSESESDEGMMWSPLNIATVDVGATTGGEEDAPSPPLEPQQTGGQSSNDL